MSRKYKVGELVRYVGDEDDPFAIRFQLTNDVVYEIADRRTTGFNDKCTYIGIAGSGTYICAPYTKDLAPHKISNEERIRRRESCQKQPTT
jgi:hypothetical protein